MNDEDLQAQQREVQRLLGRCLLRLQQYERLMKGIVAHHDISGPAHELASVRAARVHEASMKTLGTLVGRLFVSCILTEGADDTANEPVESILCPDGRDHAFGQFAATDRSAHYAGRLGRTSQ